MTTEQSRAAESRDPAHVVDEAIRALGAAGHTQITFRDLAWVLDQVQRSRPWLAHHLAQLVKRGTLERAGAGVFRIVTAQHVQQPSPVPAAGQTSAPAAQTPVFAADSDTVAAYMTGKFDALVPHLLAGDFDSTRQILSDMIAERCGGVIDLLSTAAWTLRGELAAAGTQDHSAAYNALREDPLHSGAYASELVRAARRVRRGRGGQPCVRRIARRLRIGMPLAETLARALRIEDEHGHPLNLNS